jgi:release factor glutamine methyltransferase
MTIHQAQQQLLFQLYHLYDNREAANIADWVMEHITGWKKIDRIVNKQVPLLPEKLALLEQFTQELLAHKPVQYVLHEAWFCGMPFYVDENVLIPRPETEELVEWVAEEAKPNATILDIGTGSGCIPIALKKKLPNATIYSCDVSADALEVAKRNAVTLKADIQFVHVNFLQNREQLDPVDIIVSNPPYIPVSNKSTMQPNVLQYEPHLALFVENDDPLLFYNTIADFAQHKLLPGGAIYVEIHEDLGEQTKALFSGKGFAAVELRKDMQGKDRMVKAVKVFSYPPAT